MASTTNATQNGNGHGVATVELRDIPISQIVVAEGFNPRGEVVEDADLQAMAATMRERGCLQPIRVRATETGDFALIAGERRYRAATLAALTTLPAVVLTAGAGDEGEYLDLLTDAMIENELRSDLDPLQRARGYQAMIDGGLGVRAVAERLGGKAKRSSREKRIKEHLAILSLPERLRTLVAEQVIPLLAVKTLVELAEIHEEFAHAALRAVTPDGDDSEPYTWQELIENPVDIAMNHMDELPAGVYSSRNSYPVDQFTLSEKAQKDLAAYTKLTDGGQITGVRFGTELVEQARLLGATHEASWFSIILGDDVASRLAEDYIAGVVKEARARQRREREMARSSTADSADVTTSSSAGTPAVDEPESAEERAQREADEAKAERAERQRKREDATKFNLDLGLLVFKHLPKVKVDERVLRILASVDLGGSLSKIAARGARLALPTWVEQAAQEWASLTETHDPSEVALISDASNQEIARLNARAQHFRSERGELGDLEVPVPGVHYGVRQGDRIALIEQHREPGIERIENGSRGEILDITAAGEVLVEFDVTGRQQRLSGEDLGKLRLGYAQHIHRAQGATVTRTLVVTGGWQTSKEPAYVEASRARQGTDWYVSRQDLGVEGHDTDRIQRLAQSMSRSHAQTPSLAHPELPDPSYGPGLHLPIAPSRTSPIPGIVREAINRIINPPAPERTR